MENLEFRDWYQNEGAMDVIQKLPRMAAKLVEIVPQLTYRLPQALHQINQDSKLQDVVQNRSAILGIIYALRDIDAKAFVKELEELQLKDLAHSEALIRTRFLPIWRMLVKLMDFLHITPILSYSIPKLGEFVALVAKLPITKNEEEFVKTGKQAALALKDSLHQLFSSVVFSGLAVKVLGAFGFTLLAGKIGLPILLLWAAMWALNKTKGSMPEALANAFASLYYFMFPYEAQGLAKERPPTFSKFRKTEN